MLIRALAFVIAVSQVLPPTTLPAAAAASLRASLSDAARHPKHIWRDTATINDDGTVNGYVEIPKGERKKYEFSIALHERVVDRVMSREVGGYPVNYGFVPQTISYDGDPFDILVLGEPLRGGAIVRGVIVGIMHMEDEKGVDSKVVVSPVDSFGRATEPIRANDQRRMTEFFDRYKKDEPGKFSRVLGWGGLGEARAFLMQTRSFFRECATRTDGDCTVTPSP